MRSNILRLVASVFCVVLFAGCVRAGPTTTESQVIDPRKQANTRVTNYEECVAAGFAVTKSFPPRCVAPNGIQFIKPRVQPPGAVACDNRCGDGVCQQIVCQAVGCPCAETPVNCAADCAASAF